jgi:magnesium-transporting ATPase (P-type)
MAITAKNAFSKYIGILLSVAVNIALCLFVIQCYTEIANRNLSRLVISTQILLYTVLCSIILIVNYLDKRDNAKNNTNIPTEIKAKHYQLLLWWGILLLIAKTIIVMYNIVLFWPIINAANYNSVLRLAEFPIVFTCITLIVMFVRVKKSSRKF